MLPSNPTLALPPRFKVPASAGSVTIFTNALSGNDNGDQGISFRTVTTVGAAAGALTQVRVTFKASSTGTSLQLNHASFGKWTGANPGVVSAGPDELKFNSGVSGFTISAGASITSDWTTLTAGNVFALSDSVVVIADTNASAGHGDYAQGTGVSGLTGWFFTGATWNLTAPSIAGFSSAAGVDWGVVSIETQ